MNLPLNRNTPPPVPPHVLDDADYLRAERLRQYSYSPARRTIQFVRGLLAPVPYGALGTDLSKWQPEFDFLVAQVMGVLWAYIRALYGLTPDLKFPVHYQNAKPILPRTAYLYYIDSLDPKAQAKKLFDTCQANGDIGDFAVVFDLEGINNPTLTASKVKTCLEELTKLFAKKPLIYSGYYVIRDLLKGDKTFLVLYSLLIAAYPFGFQWFNDLPEKVLSYPPLIPEPFQMWTENPDEPLEGRVVGWQFTSSAPGALYGASSTFLDLDICSPAFLKQVLNGSPPPVPPLAGELQMQFINTGGDISNIRAAPVVNSANIIGKLPDGAKVVAQEIKFVAGYAWVKYAVQPAWLLPGKTDTLGWSALVAITGTPLIDFHAALPCPELLP